MDSKKKVDCKYWGTSKNAKKSRDNSAEVKNNGDWRKEREDVPKDKPSSEVLETKNTNSEEAKGKDDNSKKNKSSEATKVSEEAKEKDDNSKKSISEATAVSEKADDKDNNAKKSKSTEDAEKAKDKDANVKKRRPSESAEDGEKSEDIKPLKKRRSSESDEDHRLWQGSDEELCESKNSILELFLVNMPTDFYQFWDFVKVVGVEGKEKPFKQFGLELVGPFDSLASRFGRIKQRTRGEYLRHWRFFYDPPEFQTIFWKRDTGVHYGYWRDDPKDSEHLMIARNDAGKGCTFEFIATNAFDALAYFLEKDFVSTPFTQLELTHVRKALNDYVTKRKVERTLIHTAKTKRMKAIIKKTFHGAGFVVPIDKKTNTGYRGMMESPDKLRKILSMLDNPDDPIKAKRVVMEELDPIIKCAVIAFDEFDFGTSLELGINLFCSGYRELHSTIMSLLIPAYKFLDRQPFQRILRAHLQDRKRGFNLSVI